VIPREASLFRLYSNANERWHGAPLYRAVVEAARRLELAGASVFPVELGYGAHRQIHDLASEYSSFDIPIVVEIVDAAGRVMPLVGELESIVTEGLIVVSPVQVLRYTHAVERGETERPRLITGPPSLTKRVSAAEGTSQMKIEGDAKRVTVYVGSADTWGERNLAVAIVEQCRAMGMAGATVSRGVMGFGKHSVIHKAHFLGLSDDLPEKIEVVDRPEEIDRLLPVLDQMIGGGLVVVEDVHVVRYLHEPKRAKGAMP
jgi:PII-like signaling protein